MELPRLQKWKEGFNCRRKLYEADPFLAESSLVLIGPVTLKLFYLKMQIGRLLKPCFPDPFVYLEGRDLRHYRKCSYSQNAGSKSSPSTYYQ